MADLLRTLIFIGLAAVAAGMSMVSSGSQGAKGGFQENITITTSNPHKLMRSEKSKRRSASQKMALSEVERDMPTDEKDVNAQHGDLPSLLASGVSAEGDVASSSTVTQALSVQPRHKLTQIIGDAGWAVCIVVFIWADGTRTGFSTDNGGNKLDLYNENGWHKVGQHRYSMADGESVVRIHGTNCKGPGYPGQIFKIVTTSRTITIQGEHRAWDDDAFDFSVPNGEVFRDIKLSWLNPNRIIGLETEDENKPLPINCATVDHDGLCTLCTNNRYLSTSGDCLQTCPAGSTEETDEHGDRKCVECRGETRRRAVTGGSLCTSCPNGHIPNPNHDDCQNIQDTCDPQQCQQCGDCMDQAIPELEKCGTAACIDFNQMWCPQWMDTLVSCEGFSIGCYHKLLCHSPKVCPSWKNVRCGGKRTDSLLDVTSLLQNSNGSTVASIDAFGPTVLTSSSSDSPTDPLPTDSALLDRSGGDQVIRRDQLDYSVAGKCAD